MVFVCFNIISFFFNFIYKKQLPEIETTLDLVNMLKMKRENEEELIANYPLSEVVHARAK
jgi:hypothetical protein